MKPIKLIKYKKMKMMKKNKNLLFKENIIYQINLKIGVALIGQKKL